MRSPIEEALKALSSPKSQVEKALEALSSPKSQVEKALEALSSPKSQVEKALEALSTPKSRLESVLRAFDAFAAPSPSYAHLFPGDIDGLRKAAELASSFDSELIRSAIAASRLMEIPIDAETLASFRARSPLVDTIAEVREVTKQTADSSVEEIHNQTIKAIDNLASKIESLASMSRSPQERRSLTQLLALLFAVLTFVVGTAYQDLSYRLAQQAELNNERDMARLQETIEQAAQSQTDENRRAREAIEKIAAQVDEDNKDKKMSIVLLIVPHD